VIIVDNGSSDNTRGVIAGYAVVLLEETAIRSSYAARNRGIARARGEILAFTDADCLVTPDWIREGIRLITDGSADLVGGRVEFLLSSGQPAAGIFDASSHMHSEDLVSSRKEAATANLFVRADVPRRIGPFPQTVRSGGDMIWTRSAVSTGFRLAYAANAVVRHPARNLPELLRKGFRVGTGAPQIARRKGESPGELLKAAIRSVLPGGPGPLRRRIARHGFNIPVSKFFRVWGVSYAYGLAWASGVFAGIARELVLQEHRETVTQERGRQ
jgi:glycosyltransferase involved in cell wall biosynthesis